MHGARRQAAASRVVVIEKPAHDLARGIQTADRVAGGVLDLGLRIDLQAAKRERDTERIAVLLVRIAHNEIAALGRVQIPARRVRALAAYRV